MQVQIKESKREIQPIKSISVDVSHQPTTNEINTTDKVFSHVLGKYSEAYPRPDKGVLGHLSLSETVEKLNTLPKYKPQDKHKNPALLRGIYEGGIKGEYCIKTTPFIPLDIDVKKAKDNHEGENLPLLKNELDNNNVFRYLKTICPIVFRSSSGLGIGGFVYVPELQHYINDTPTHKRIAEAIYIEIEKLIKKHCGVMVTLDPMQGGFRQIRNILGQDEKITLNKKPLAFHYKVNKVVKKSKSGVIQYQDNYIRTGDIIQQFNQSQSIEQLLNDMSLFEVCRNKRVKYANSPSKDVGSYSFEKNVLFNHSGTLASDLGTDKKAITPFDLVYRLNFNRDFKACMRHLESLGYKTIKPKQTDVQTAENKLKLALKDAPNPDKLIYKYCKQFSLLSLDDKLEFIKKVNPPKQYLKYFHEYFNLNDTTSILYHDQIEIKKYVSEAIPKIVDLIEKHNKILLKSETGSGKTYAFINGWRKLKPDSRGLLIAPLTIIVDQLEAEYKNECSFLTGKSKRDDHTEATKSNFVVATYEQGIKHLEATDFDYVIVDEAHQLIMANSYKAEIIEQLTNQLQKHKGKLIGLSGTPSRLFESLGFRLVDLKQTESTKTDVNVIYWNEKPLNIALKHIHPTDKTRRYLFRLNEIDTLYDIKDKLVKDGTYKAKEILILHSSPDIKNSDQFQHLYLNSTIKENKKVVLTTSLIDEGVTIRDNFTDCVFINNDFEPKAEPIKQFFARFRSGKLEHTFFNDISVNRTNYLYLKHTKTEKPRSKFNLLADYSEKLEILNKDAEDLTFEDLKSTYKDFTDTSDFYHEDNSVNEFYLANHVLSQFYRRINRHQFLAYLGQNFNINTNILSTPEKPTEAIKGTSKAKKKERIYKMLTEDKNLLLLRVKRFTQNKRLSQDIEAEGEIPNTNEIKAEKELLDKTNPRWKELNQMEGEINEPNKFVKTNIKMIESLIKSHLSLKFLGSEDILQNLTKEGKLKTSVEIQNEIFKLRTNKTIITPQTEKDKKNADKIKAVINDLMKLKTFHLKDFQKILKQKKVNNFNKYTHATLKSLLKSQGVKFKFNSKYKSYVITNGYE